MKLSVILPALYLTAKHYVLTKECLESLKGVDEIVLVESGEKPSDFKADIKVFSPKPLTVAEVWNVGAKKATGDFLAIINNDTKLIEGNLKDLCQDGIVTSPVINGIKQDFWGPFFVLPKEVYQKIGEFDERFRNYCEDDDYRERLKMAGIKMMCVETVKISHVGGATGNYTTTVETNKENIRKFQEKWGKLPY